MRQRPFWWPLSPRAASRRLKAALPAYVAPSTTTTTPLASLAITFDFYGNSGRCYGVAGFQDIREGTPVRVTDDTGRLIGVAILDAGLANQVGARSFCRFSMNAQNMEVGRTRFVGVQIGARPVSDLPVSQVAGARFWSIDLTLG